MKPVKASRAVERSVEEVRDRLREERKNLDRIITRQSFFCSRRMKLVSPAQCHDCFAHLPYLERLTRWSENRTRCIEAHRAARNGKTEKSKVVNVTSGSPGSDVQPRSGRGQTVFSVDEYVNRGLLEFLLELDAMAERFSVWADNLARPARERIHASAEIGEMIVWLSDRLERFRRSVVRIGRDNLTDNMKEEQCGVKNSPSTS